MTTIPLKLIRPSPHPVRTSWDEDKLNELAASIAEQGVIVPVKVRQVGDTPCTCGYEGDWHKMDRDRDIMQQRDDEAYPDTCDWCDTLWDTGGADDEQLAAWREWPPAFELVYGHRRVEAARRAGLTEVPAIVEAVDDTAALIQALIENVQREDMTDEDKGGACIALRELTGKTLIEIGEMFGYHDRGSQVSRWVTLVGSPEGAAFRSSSEPTTDAAGKAQSIRRVLGEDVAARTAVASKVVRESLSEPQTRRVAESVAAAPDERTRKALLDTPYSPAVHDCEVVKDRERFEDAQRFAAQKREPSWDREAKMMIEDIDRFGRTVARWRESTDAGVVSPEAQRFMARRMQPHLDALAALAEEWTHAES